MQSTESSLESKYPFEQNLIMIIPTFYTGLIQEIEHLGSSNEPYSNIVAKAYKTQRKKNMLAIHNNV